MVQVCEAKRVGAAIATAEKAEYERTVARATGLLARVYLRLHSFPLTL